MPDTLESCAIKLRSVVSAYEIWDNRVKILTVGKVSELKDNSTPDFQPKIVRLNNSRIHDLTFVISNYHHRKGGGTWEPIYIGKYSEVERMNIVSYSHELIAAVILFTISLFHLMLYLFYPKERSYFILSGYALSGVFFIIFRGEMVVQTLFPSFPYHLEQKMRYVSFYLNSSIMIWYVHDLFYEKVNKIVRIFLLFTVLFCLTTILVPVHVGTYLPPVFQVLSIPFGVHAFYLVYKHRKVNPVESYFLIGGGLVLLFLMIHGALVSFYFLPGTYIHVYAFSIFVISQVLMLAYRHRKVYGEKERLKTDLNFKKKDLSVVVSDNLLRTKVNEKLKENLMLLSHETPTTIYNKVRSLLNDLEVHENFNKKLNLEQANINTINSEFRSKLLLICSDLSDGELELCNYILLNKSIKDIANLRGSSEGAVKVARHRLKKKLNINDSNLDHFIKDL